MDKTFGHKLKELIFGIYGYEYLVIILNSEFNIRITYLLKYKKYNKYFTI